ncbi:MAG: hypothetical protein R3324_20565, partial [Halobacteriales archaeon]|nr:hypothetical protein [Halobacteriales archaeon]
MSFHVTAPERIGEDFFEVPGARLHFFTTEGATVACPADPIDLDQACVWAGDPDQTTLSDGSVETSTWPDHVVVRSGSTGRVTVDFTPGTGEHRLFAFGCGVASEGPEADPPGEPGADGVWGSLQPTCEDRRAATFDYTLLANGPEDGDRTPFEPVDTEYEVAVGGIPSVVIVETCPTITVNGIKDGTEGSEWEACAEKTPFNASLPGSKDAENAWLYTWDDGESLYIGLEVLADQLGSRIFVQLAETYASDGVEAPGDDILIIDFDDGGPGTVADWHLTQACIDNSASNLCGNLDALDDDASDPGVFTTLSGAARVDGAGSGRTFYEF